MNQQPQVISIQNRSFDLKGKESGIFLTDLRPFLLNLEKHIRGFDPMFADSVKEAIADTWESTE